MTKRRGGFGLVEVMVAVTIIMIVLGGTGALVNQSINATGDAREKIIAEGLAQDMLEKARNNRDLNRALNNAANNFPVQGQTVTVHNTSYCQSFDEISETGLVAKRVTATIKWPGCGGDQKYILTTILYNHD